MTKIIKLTPHAMRRHFERDRMASVTSMAAHYGTGYSRMLGVLLDSALKENLAKSFHRHRQLFLQSLKEWHPLWGITDLNPRTDKSLDLHPIIEQVYRHLNVQISWVRAHGLQHPPDRVLAHAWYAKSQPTINNPGAFLQAKLQQHEPPPHQEHQLARQLVETLDQFEADQITAFFTQFRISSKRTPSVIEQTAKNLIEKDALLLIPASRITIPGVTR